MTRKRNGGHKGRRSHSNGVQVADDSATRNDEEPEIVAAEAERTITASEFIADIDDTGTFMGLDDPDEEGPDDGEALISLQRLEGDIRELHSRWANVESELAARDMEIGRLQEEGEIHHAAFKSLQSELDEGRLRESEYQDQADSIREQLTEQESRLQMQLDELAARDQAIKAGREALEDMQAQRDNISQTSKALEQELADQAKNEEAVRKKDEEKQAVISELRVKNQEFESYIDRRKADWDNLNNDLASSRDALADMEKAIATKESEFSGQEKERVRLSQAIIDLEKRYAEMNGRRAEREQANQELQELLNERASELETLRNELRQAEAVSAPLQKEIEKQAAELLKARNEITRLESQAISDRQSATAAEKELRSKYEGEIASMHQQLTDSLDANSQAQKELADSQQRATEMEADIVARQTELEKARTASAATDEKLGQVAEERDTLRAKCDDLKTRLAELKLEFADHRRISSQDLEESTSRAAELAVSLKTSNAALQTLNRNVKIVGKINDSVQRLDKQMSNGPNTGGERATARKQTRRLMVAIQGEQKIRYPIYKNSTTIGRSPESDIQIRQKWISRQHARIVISDEAVTIEDMGSKNGILVNNKPIRAGVLNDQDMVD
ncbi:MAG: FHA domain-containing protein, partial [Gammaproteobacteria bacterium]